MHVLETRYGADVVQEIDDGVLHFTLSASLGHVKQVSPSMVADILYERTKFVDFLNETDAGTYGSEYVYRQISEDIERGFFPTEPWNARQSAESLTAALPPDQFPQLHLLASRGYCLDAGAIESELGKASSDISLPPEQRDAVRRLLQDLTDGQGRGADL